MKPTLIGAPRALLRVVNDDFTCRHYKLKNAISVASVTERTNKINDMLRLLSSRSCDCFDICFVQANPDVQITFELSNNSF